MHQEIQEIHNLLINLLDNCQSDVTMENSGGFFSTVDSRAGLNGLDAITPFGSSHDRCFVPQCAPHGTLFGVTRSLSEGMCTGLLPHGARSSADYGPVIQHPLTQPRYTMYSEAFSAFCDPRVTESSLEGEDGQFTIIQQLLVKTLTIYP